MGAVYEARHTGTGRRVAVKVVTGPLATDPDLVSRFEREARAAGAIESEHIVQVLDVGQDGPSSPPYLAMEYLVGEDLADVLDRLGPVPPDTALRIGVQACLGLEKAHAAGIVHRDVKPANLFLSRRESGEIVVKLLDFGIAKVNEGEVRPERRSRALTRTGAILGSPLYMSPEQSRSRGPIDHRTDLWSLGVVLYEALAGRTPFEHVTSMGDFIVSVCTVPSTPIREHAPWVDPMLAQAVERAIAIDPAGRYQSAAEMREALSVFLPSGASLQTPMLVRAPEAGPAPEHPPPPPEQAPTVAASPVVMPATPTPMPATIPGEPIAASFTPPVAVGGSPPVPAAPPAPVPWSNPGPWIAGLVVVAAAGIGSAYALGWIGGGKPEPERPAHVQTVASEEAPVKKPPPSTASLHALAGAWWGENGVQYDGVVAGDAVQLELHDPETLPGLGYTAGEAVFVLRPIEGSSHELRVEAHVRPAPPRGFVYDHPRSAATCVSTWTHAGDKELRAELALDRLVIQTVRIEPPEAMFARQGIRVVG